MDRRTLLQFLAMTPALSVLTSQMAKAHDGIDRNAPKPKVGMLIHPEMVLLDHVPAHTAFALTMSDITLVWKSREPVSTDIGISLMPEADFESCPRDLDVLFVPGGLGGTIKCIEDPAVVDFIADRGARAKWVTSVCTGSLLLGAAGLLRGYRATGHWHSKHLLSHFDAVVTNDRVVSDRNRVTGGGVTAGLDFGLAIASKLRGENWAKSIQLILEYDPQPPFAAGNAQHAGRAVVDLVDPLLTPQLKRAQQAVEHVLRKHI